MPETMTLDQARRIDTGGMYDLIRQFPAQWAEGRRIAEKAAPGLTVSDLDEVVVAGMGGSAIGGDLLRAFALDRSPVPISVSRSYELPHAVGPRTLFIASSYSGNTEETLAAFEVALARKARLFCIASGGRLLERARQTGQPHLVIPGGMPPRAALAYSLTALLQVADRVGFASVSSEEWEETQDLLSRKSRELSGFAGNAAQVIAEQLEGRLPILYSGVGLMEPVNLRWRCQINENAKALAYGNVFPELNHNEIMGFEGVEWLLPRLAVVVLRDRSDPPQIGKRMRVTREILEDRVGHWAEVETEGEGRLARLLSLVHLGDWVSFYLAMRTNTDPTPIGFINRLKEALAQP